MNKRKVALGPGAASLILIVVVLSLCMMAMLTQISARSDYNLCNRSAEMVQRVYELNAQSEKKLAELDTVLVSARKDAGSMDAYLKKVGESLPEGMTLDGDKISSVSFRCSPWKKKSGPSGYPINSSLTSRRKTGNGRDT